VYVRFYDEYDFPSSGYYVLDGPGDDLERGDTNYFSFTTGDLGSAPCMHIYITGSCSGDSSVDGWYGLDVTLSDDIGRSWVFPLNDWLDDASGRTTSRTICLP